MAIKNPGRSSGARAAETRKKALELRTPGLSYRQTGEQLSVSKTVACKHVLNAIESLEKESREGQPSSGSGTTRELDKHSLVTGIKELRNKLCGTEIREDKPNACREHPTMKPVDLIVSMLRNSSTRGDIVPDLCGGSGSTLIIACEKPGRHARVMELDTHAM